MSKERIPREIYPFDPYLVRVFTMLSALVGISIPPVYMWQQLGLTADEFAKITAIFKRWRSGDPAAPGAYELHDNIFKITKTEDTRKLCIKVIDDFVLLFTPLLIRMEGSPNITSALRTTLNIAEPNPEYVRHTAEITDACYTKTISTIGEKVEFECSSETNSKRPSMLKDQGEMVIETILSVLPPSIDANKNVIPPLAPTGSNDPTLNLKQTSVKASFFIDVIPESSRGKILQGFCRWRDVHNTKRKGPWTPIPPTQIN